MADPYNQHHNYPKHFGGGYDQTQYQQHQQYASQYPQGGYLQDPTSTSYPPETTQASYRAEQSQYGQQQGTYFQPPQQRPPQGAGFGQVVPDALVSDLAANVLQQQGENYFQRGQAFVQSKMGFLSSNNLQYHFNIDTSYVRDKLLLLLVPFLRQWSFSRKAEQITGGNRYQPPRQDIYAPDLYIPFMAACTYVILVSIAQTSGGRFTHDNVYVTVSGALTAWVVHWFVFKAFLYLLGIPSAMPFLEVLAYAGYPFVYACLGLTTSICGGLWPYRAVLVYGGLAMGTFMVRTMKHVLFHDSPHSSGGSRLNYLLLGLAIFQFPFLAWLYVKP